MSDQELIRDFVRTRSEQAFAELVRRYVGLVYSTAVRCLKDHSSEAGDVTQQVFLDLAAKASTLQHHPKLTGWLHTSTRFAASRTVRGEVRRRHYETEAVMKAPDQSPQSNEEWTQIKPLIAFHDGS